MERDVHYYLVYKLAVLAGFDAPDAESIAYASQYVDDATESEPITVDGERFDTVRTAHYGLWAFNWDVQKKIYIPFHFLPPKPRSRIAYAYASRRATDKDCVSARKLFDIAKKEMDAELRLIRIGVAVHTISDTFSHYGFSGRWNNENDVKGIWLKENGGWDHQNGCTT